MVDSVSETTSSCMEKNQLVEKVQEQEGVFRKQPSQHSLPSRHTLDILSPSLHLATF